WRSCDRLLDRSTLRRALARGSGDRHVDRWGVAIDRTISVAVESRLQVSPRLSLARRRSARRADLDGTGGRCGERGAGERADQQRICGQSWQWPGELAQYRVPFVAIAAGNFR